MKQINILYFLLALIFLSLIGLFIWRSQNKSQPAITPLPTPTTQIPNTPSPTIAPSDTPNINGLVPPISQFKQRVTKKFYGTYITPNNSPVSPERFTGYHTGVDVEYTDVTIDVPVVAITDGSVVSSGFGSGYGGVMVIKHIINNQTLYATYGHLRQSSMLKTGTAVTQGEQIGVLGTGYTNETDGERRHLHFGIANKNTNRGYVGSLAELHATWVDPLTLYP